ncbi:LVIVD repeat-containing protein [Melittangium boletus]|uniref:LVIVD repeat-containing protein n=1 Tax=Melittangium boletus TaxID=83453 RepID=UPI003DA3D994
MNRLLLVMTGALLPALVGCSNTVDTEPKRDCEFEAFDVSACDAAALASVKAEGIWNANVVLGGVDAPGTVRFPGAPLLFNTPMSEQRVGDGTFFLAGDYPNGAISSRLVLSGCQAPSATQVTGTFRRCSNGAGDLTGHFEAVRLQRRAGEQEAEGVALVSETPLPRGMASDVFVAGGFAYVTALSDGLFIYDVSKPEHPEKLAELSPSNDVWYRAWVRGQTLYVSSSKEGVILYDVRNPKAPTRITDTSWRQAVQGWGLVVDQDRLYLMSPAPRGEVLIYDLSKDANKPSLLARYYAEESLLANGETPVEGVVFNDRLYVGHWRYGLVVADVKTPTKPVTLGHFGYDKATSRPVAVGVIEGDGRTIAFEASEGWNSRIRALNVTDPAHIEQVGQFQLRPESTVSGLTLVGSRLYVAHAQDGLRILDVSNPSTPKPRAYYNTWRESDPGRGQAFLEGLSGVKVPGDGYLYAAETSRGLMVFREQ